MSQRCQPQTLADLTTLSAPASSGGKSRRGALRQQRAPCGVRDSGSSSRTRESDAVRCIKCELENRAGRKFCASCGTALPVPCENCGFANEAAERYCGGCGHPLVGERIGAIEAERNVDPEGDRRPVTVLFCDLVGYTQLSSLLDAEDVHSLLERFFALVDATVDRFGGTIDKHIGDAAMALFGRILSSNLCRSGRSVDPPEYPPS